MLCSRMPLKKNTAKTATRTHSHHFSAVPRTDQPWPVVKGGHISLHTPHPLVSIRFLKALLRSPRFQGNYPVSAVSDFPDQIKNKYFINLEIENKQRRPGVFALWNFYLNNGNRRKPPVLCIQQFLY